MIEQIPNLIVDKNCEKILQKCLLESDMDATYYTLDEISSRLKTSPPKLQDIMDDLKKNKFAASPTSFSPTGFRTDANITQIIGLF